uniref:LAGLIDADG endonuclease n=1 Tax=Glomus cerebriforme TaxID=658196 RepID=S5PLI8_9GLOM|nr:LAGLIDADG endonuclease [Glomus cerebriforme]AGR84066.1 LAGLIDADG endonuclease [Glomus cerebriforme]
MVTYGLGNSTRCGNILLRPELLEYLMMGFFLNLKHLYSVKRFLGNVRAYITLQGPPTVLRPTILAPRAEDKVFTEWLVPGLGMFISGFSKCESCFSISVSPQSDQVRAFYIIGLNNKDAFLLNRIKALPAGPKGECLSTKTETSEFLEYFVGFVDGDGCFSVCKCGNYYYLKFSISQALYNIRILYYIKSKLGYGSVKKNKNKGVAEFKITNRKVLAKIIFPIFDTFLLRTSKYWNYVLFKKAYVILEDPHLTSEDKARLLESLLKEPLPIDNCSPALNNLDPLLSSYEEISLVITDNWLSGFVEAKGCFEINPDGQSFNVEFFLVQKLDKKLLELIRRILHIPGKIIKNQNLNVLNTKNKRALNNIKGIFEGKFKGMKALEFKLVCKALYYRETNQPKVANILYTFRKLKAKGNLGSQTPGPSAS